MGKIDVAVAAKNSKRVYALIQTADQGSIWRSDDGGENWKVRSWQRALIGRAGFYIRLAVSPANPDEVLVANSSFHMSTDGGKSFRTMPWGGDTHDIWVDPKDANRILVTHDGGMFMTTDHGKTSNRRHASDRPAVSRRRRTTMFRTASTRNMQDNGTMRGLSTTPESGPNVPSAAPAGGGGFGGGRQAAGGVWDHGLGGCESGFTIPDPTDSNIVWSSCYGFELTRYDFRTKLARSVSPVQHTLDSEPNKLKYRAHWTPPLRHRSVRPQHRLFRGPGRLPDDERRPELEGHQPRPVDAGPEVHRLLGRDRRRQPRTVLRGSDLRDRALAGQERPDLGRDERRQSLAHEERRREVDRRHRPTSRACRPGGRSRRSTPSAHDPATAYIAVDFHLMDNRDPWIFKTSDYGATWTKITGDLPKGHPLDYIRVVTENPNRKGMLFAGSGHALYYSMNDGQNWKRLKDGLPPAPVSWIIVQKQTHDLVVSTYGRGIYIMDDITPLEQGLPEAAPASEPRARHPASGLPAGARRTAPSSITSSRRRRRIRSSSRSWTRTGP